jgi:hypothetical protein
MSEPRIFYYAAQTDQPSWGIGMLYTHVALLRRNGFDAYLLHDRAPFRVTWYASGQPAVYLDDGSFAPAARDLLIVPEILAARPFARECPARKIVFVQGSSLIVKGLKGASLHSDLGYECAIAVMPHIQAVLTRFFDLPSTVIPPCIAPYCFEAPGAPRKRVIALYPKTDAEDFPIVRDLLRRHLAAAGGWEVVELQSMSHREVAAILRSAALHVNVNCQESFNATVPEAMAAGAIAVCYEGFGGQDYLRDGVNARVFPNHYVYPLVECALDLAARFKQPSEELDALRRRAFETASLFTEAATEAPLLAFYRELVRTV